MIKPNTDKQSSDMTKSVTDVTNPVTKRKRGHQPGVPLKEKHKEAIAAKQIMNIVKQAAEGTRVVTANQLRAADLYLSKTVPSLTAVEQTILNDQDTKSAEQIQSELQALIQANPELLTMLLATIPKSETNTLQPLTSMH